MTHLREKFGVFCAEKCLRAILLLMFVYFLAVFRYFGVAFKAEVFLWFLSKSILFCQHLGEN